MHPVKLNSRIESNSLYFFPGFCSPGHYCTGSADTAAPKAKAVQLTCFCDLLLESSHSEYYLCAQRDNSACTAHSTGMLSYLKQTNAPVVGKVQPVYLFHCAENGNGNCTSVISRFSSASALTEPKSESVCKDFTGDICPIGKSAAF